MATMTLNVDPPSVDDKSYSNGSEWNVFECLNTFLNDKIESKGSLYGTIDGVENFSHFLKNLTHQGLTIKETPEAAGTSILSDPEYEIDRIIDLVNGKFTFDWKAGEETVNYGSPFYISNEKTLFCKFDNDTYNPQNLVKFTAKVIKIFENYKILRGSPKLCEKRSMITILKDALQSNEPPVPLIRYIIGVPNFHLLQATGKGNIPQKPPKRKVAGQILTDKPKKAKTNEKKVKNPKKQTKSNSLQCKWSDSSEIMIPRALGTQKNPMLEVRTKQKPNASPTKPNKHVRRSNKFSEQPLLNSETALIRDSQSIIHEDLPLIATQEDIGFHPPDIDLLPDMQTMHMPPFKIPVSLNHNFNLDHSPDLSSSSSSTNSPKKEKKYKKKKSKDKHKEKVGKRAPKTSEEKVEERLQNSNFKLKHRAKREKNNLDFNEEVVLSRENGHEVDTRQSPGKAQKVKKVAVNRQYSFNLQDIVKSQEDVRNQIEIMTDMSFMCADVACLKELGLQLNEILVQLRDSLPPEPSQPDT